MMTKGNNPPTKKTITTVTKYIYFDSPLFILSRGEQLRQTYTHTYTHLHIYTNSSLIGSRLLQPVKRHRGKVLNSDLNCNFNQSHRATSGIGFKGHFEGKFIASLHEISIDQ